MLLNDNEVTKRLSSPKNLALRFNRAVVVPPRTRGPEVPQFLKNLAGVLANSGEKVVSISKEFDLPKSSVHAYKNGENGVDKSLINKTVEKASEKALDRLMKSLDLMDDNKLAASNARDLSGIAANMGKVVDKLRPREDASRTLVIYAPNQKSERDFKVIDI